MLYTRYYCSQYVYCVSVLITYVILLCITVHGLMTLWLFLICLLWYLLCIEIPGMCGCITYVVFYVLHTVLCLRGFYCLIHLALHMTACLCSVNKCIHLFDLNVCDPSLQGWIIHIIPQYGECIPTTSFCVWRPSCRPTLRTRGCMLRHYSPS